MSSLAPGTRQSYKSAVNCYIGFCRLFHILSPFPLSQAILSRFVVHMANKGLSYVTIRVYLSGLRFMQIASGLPDPALSSFCHLEYVLRGIRKSSSCRRRPQRLPVTPHILSCLFRAWSQPPVSQDRVMLWAACCTGFFGFFRSGEFTCSSLHAFSESVLLVSDVSVDSRSDPSFVSIYLRQSKTDVFGTGSVVYLGRVDGPICPVKALLSYIALRGVGPGPLFLFQDGTPLSRPALVGAVRRALESQGLDVSRFNGHSFRIGAATTAAACGISDSLIQALGRWKSSAFTSYIQTPKDTLVSVAARLLSQ